MCGVQAQCDAITYAVMVFALYGIPSAAIREQIGRQRAPQSTVPSQPSRWRGSVELNHLLWLLIHYQESLAPLLVDIKPTLISDRVSVLRAISL